MSKKTMNFDHSRIWKRDNIEVMRRMNNECVDMIYLDPPFDPKCDYAKQNNSISITNAGKEAWTINEIDVESINRIYLEHPQLYQIIIASHTESKKAYLVYIAIRLIEMRRILKRNGTIYLHCDPKMSHWLKLLMDSIFGEKNFRNEIVWFFDDSTGRPKRDFARKHNIILRYTKDFRAGDWIFNLNDVKVPLKEGTIERYKYARVLGGTVTVGGDTSGKVPEDVWFISTVKGSKKVKGFRTQKPEKLLDIIIKASSNTGDLIFDPFCGSGTTLLSAENLKRKWIGIEYVPEIAELAKERIETERVSSSSSQNSIKLLKRLPDRTDIKKQLGYNKLCNELYKLQGESCKNCQNKFTVGKLQLAMIIPKSRGGTDESSNKQLLCNDCKSIGNRGAKQIRLLLKFEAN